MRSLGRWRGSDAVGSRCNPVGDAARAPRAGKDAGAEPGEVIRLTPDGDRWVGRSRDGRRWTLRRAARDQNAWELLTRPDPIEREPWPNVTGAGRTGEPAVLPLQRPGADPERVGVAPSGGRAVDLAAIRLDPGDGFGGVQFARLNAYQRYLDAHYGD